MQGDDQEDTEKLAEMSKKADNYITSYRWCPDIKEKYFGFGVGGIFAVFLYRFALPLRWTNGAVTDMDDWLWVIVGDLPSAYLVVDDAPTPGLALGIYCVLMEDWANCILSDNSVENCFPVAASPTKEHAEMLLKRTSWIREEIILE